MNKYISWKYMKSELQLYKWVPVILIIISILDFTLSKTGTVKDFNILIVTSSITNFIFITLFILGIIQFKYLNNKSQLDFIHSLPMKKEKILISKYLSGLILVFAPYVIIMLIINVVLKVLVQNEFDTEFLTSTNFINKTVILNGMYPFIFKQIIIGIFIYSFSLIISLITGGVIFQLLGTIVILLSPSIISEIITGLRSQFNSHVMTMRLGELTSFLSFTVSRKFESNISKFQDDYTRYICYKDLGNNNPIININSYPNKALVFYIVINILILICSIYIYKIRKSEYASTPITFYKLRVFFQTIISFEGGLILTGLFSMDLNKYSIFIVGIVGVVLSFIFCEVLLNRGFVNLFKRIIFVIPPIIILIVSFILATMV